MAIAEQTISDRIHGVLDALTRAERQLAQSVLEHYPASGLGPLTALAKDAAGSVPTVARMVQKLGYKSYSEFQAALREELRAKVKTPIAKHSNPERVAGTNIGSTVTKSTSLAYGLNTPLQGDIKLFW